MTGNEWWQAKLEARLSQGDILKDVPNGLVVFPVQLLHKRDMKGIGEAHVVDPAARPDSNGWHRFLARGPIAPVIVLSHSCELDKNEGKGRVVIAQVSPASQLTPENRDAVFQRQRISLFPLLGVPTFGDCYADLRTTTSIDRRHLDESKRVASATPTTITILQQHVAGFFVRSAAQDGA